MNQFFISIYFLVVTDSLMSLQQTFQVSYLAKSKGNQLN